MPYYRCDSILDVLFVAEQYPDAVLSMGPANHHLYSLQELIADRSAWKQWVAYQRTVEASRRESWISLFTDYREAAASTKRFDTPIFCSACRTPFTEHTTRSIMSAPLTERLAYCLRAHVNAEKQGRALSDNIKRMSADALNEYEATRAGDAVPKEQTDGG